MRWPISGSLQEDVGGPHPRGPSVRGGGAQPVCRPDVSELSQSVVVCNLMDASCSTTTAPGCSSRRCRTAGGGRGDHRAGAFHLCGLRERSLIVHALEGIQNASAARAPSRWQTSSPPPGRVRLLRAQMAPAVFGGGRGRWWCRASC